MEVLFLKEVSPRFCRLPPSARCLCPRHWREWRVSHQRGLCITTIWELILLLQVRLKGLVHQTDAISVTGIWWRDHSCGSCLLSRIFLTRFGLSLRFWEPTLRPRWLRFADQL